MQGLATLRSGAVLSRLVLSLMALYITGLPLDRWQNGIRIAEWLPARAYDVASALIGFVLLQRPRLHPKETMGEVKDRSPRELMTVGLPTPEPLRGRAVTVHLRTAYVL